MRKASEVLNTPIATPVAKIMEITGSTPIRIDNYKIIKNYSMQGICLVFNNNGAPESYWLEPKEMIQVPESFINEQTTNLHIRRLIQIS